MTDKLTAREQDYIAALVQLKSAQEPFRPSGWYRFIKRRKFLRGKRPGDMIPVMSINGMPLDVAIQTALGR